MSKLEELIAEYCPDGVECVPLWSVTIWDKRFNAVDRTKQPIVFNYPYLLAADLFALQVEGGDVFLLSTGEQTGWTTEELAGENLREGEVVTMPWGKSRAVTDCIKYYKGKFVTADNRIMTSNDTNRLLNKYLYYWFMSIGKVVDAFYRGSGIKHPDMAKVLDLSIPLPPLPVQHEIVRILDNFTELTAELTAELSKEVTCLGEQQKYYLNKLVSSANDYETKLLRELVSVKMCKRIKKDQTVSEGGVPFYKNGTLGRKADSYISLELYEEYLQRYPFPQKGAVMLSTAGTVGRAYIYDGKPAYFQDSNVVWLENDETVISNEYLYWFCTSMPWKLPTRGTIKHLHNDMILDTLITIPPREAQEEFVGFLKNSINRFSEIHDCLLSEIDARQKQYVYYRDKLLTFKEKT